MASSIINSRDQNYAIRSVRGISYFNDFGNFNYSDTYGVIRPTFYLKSDVVLSSSDGNTSNPYRIEL